MTRLLRQLVCFGFALLLTLLAGQTVATDVDVVFLQDLSGSFADDILSLACMAEDLIKDILNRDCSAAPSEIVPDVMVGIASFVDKPVPPFGGASDYEFKVDLPLTNDVEEAQVALSSGLAIHGGSDLPEAQLSALVHLSVSDEVGWREGSRKFAVLITDACFHQMGDLGGFDNVTLNNLDAVSDGSPPGAGEDYPSVDDAAGLVTDRGIELTFGIAGGPDIEGCYEEIHNDWLPDSRLISVASDSSNLIEVMEDIMDSVYPVTCTRSSNSTAEPMDCSLEAMCDRGDVDDATCSALLTLDAINDAIGGIINTISGPGASVTANSLTTAVFAFVAASVVGFVLT